MKNLVIGLFVLGLTSLGFSQNASIEFESLNNLSKSSSSTNYLAKLVDNSMSNHVKFLESKASNFKVTELPNFDGRKESFKTVFKSSKGFIIATYNNKGSIIKTKEMYQNIKLPVPVRESLFNEFPFWVVLNTTYSVSYNSNADTKKIYKIQIGKDNLKKTLKIDSEGNIN